ncbi:MAG: methionyl-tRNA formyltransferase [Lachnospiraceae bacterium]|nr:methionyl-tRNA formyltransferase [Lachnospiraceae bacterium]
MKIVFMGTPDFAVNTLKAISDAGHETALVVTQPDRPKGRGGKLQMSDVKKAALELGLEIFQPEKVKTAEACERIRSCEPDLIVVAAFGQILSREILDIPKYGCINVHASLLPRLRGASPIQTAILEGDKETGVTIQQMGEGLDTGDILAVRSLPIEDDDTGGSLFDKLAKLGAELAVETMEKISHGDIEPVPQDESRASYAGKVDKSMGLIDWNKKASELERLIRALDPWPCAYTMINGKTLKIWKASVKDGSSEESPGTVIEVTKDEVTVACGEGELILKEVQMEGKKRLTVHDLLLGNRIEAGDRLG